MTSSGLWTWLLCLYFGSGLKTIFAIEGSMSMWAATTDTLVGYKSQGSACKFADKQLGGLTAPTAQTPYIKSRRYCAVNAGMFGGGEICGACFRITYKGNHPQHLGRPGSTVVQVVDSGSWATFDCHMDAFSDVTHYNTGIFPVSYEQVACDTAGDGAVVGVLDSDYYFTKLVFSNLRYPVKDAAVSVADKQYPLKLIGGWWYVWTGGVEGPTKFKLTQTNDQHVSIAGCFGGWQNRHQGASCSASGHHAFVSAAAVNVTSNSVAASEAQEELEAAASETTEPTDANGSAPGIATAGLSPATAPALRGAAAPGTASGTLAGEVQSTGTSEPAPALLP